MQWISSSNFSKLDIGRQNNLTAGDCPRLNKKPSPIKTT